MLDELVGDLPGEIATMLLLDQMEHHVQGSGAPGAGQAIAIDLEQVCRQPQLRELAGEVLELLPVDGAAIAVEQPGTRQGVGTRADAAHHGAIARQPAQPGEHPLVAVFVAADPGADQHDGKAVYLAHRAIVPKKRRCL